MVNPDQSSNEDEAKRLAERGNKFFTTGNFEEALDCYENSLAYDSKTAAVWYEKSETLLRLNRPLEALEACEQCVCLAGVSADTWVLKGHALVELDRPQDGLQAYDQALILNKTHCNAWHGKGNALLDLRQPKEALNAYEQAIRINGELSYIWHGKANALLDLHRSKEALDASEQALALDRNYSNAWNNKGRAFAFLGRPQEALAAYQTAFALNNRRIQPMINIASLLLDLPDLIPGGVALPLAYFTRANTLWIESPQSSCIKFLIQLGARLSLGPLLSRKLLAKLDFNSSMVSLQRLWNENQKACDIPDFFFEELKENPTALTEEILLLHSGRVHHHFGDPSVASLHFRKALSKNYYRLQTHYLLIKSLDAFLEPCDDVLRSACYVARKLAATAVHPSNDAEAREEMYYIGQIFLANRDENAALAAFQAAEDFLPALYMRWFLTRSINPALADELLNRIFQIEINYLKEDTQQGFLIPPVQNEEIIRAGSPGNWIFQIKQAAFYEEIAAALAAIDADPAIVARIQALREIYRPDVEPRGSRDQVHNYQIVWQWHASAKKRLKDAKRDRGVEKAAEIYQEIEAFLSGSIELTPTAPVSDQLGKHISELASEKIPFEKIITYFYLTSQIDADSAVLLQTYLHLKNQYDPQKAKLMKSTFWSGKYMASIIPCLLAGIPALEAAKPCLLTAAGIAALPPFLDYAIEWAKEHRNHHQFPRFAVFRDDFYKYWNEFQPNNEAAGNCL